MKPKRWLTIGIVGAGLAAVLIFAFAPAPVDVETAAVRRGTFARTVDEDGKTRVRNRFVVSSPLAGTLERITLKEGDRAAAGDVVANIAPANPGLLDARTERELTARLEAAEAEVLTATANVGRAEALDDLARAEATRIGNLAGRGFVSAADRDTAALTLSSREKEVEAARESRHAAVHGLDAARAALARAMSSAKPGATSVWPVRAPAAGVVLRILQESERGVMTGTPLLEIGDPADLEVVVDVLSSDAVSIQPGDRVVFEHWGGDRLAEGRVRRVEPSAFTKISALGVEEQRVNVLIDPGPANERWASVGDGYRVDARIVVDERSDVLTIPVSALFREGGRWTAFLVVDGRARKREVTIAARGSDEAVVASGVGEGDAVILYPGASLSDGSRVRASGATR
jgi:HlyD family secretion protein